MARGERVRTSPDVQRRSRRIPRGFMLKRLFALVLTTTMVVASAPLAAQTGTSPMTIGWSTVYGCFTGPVTLTMPPNYLYLTGPFPNIGSMYGCGSSNLGPWNTPSVGWVGSTTPPSPPTNFGNSTPPSFEEFFTPTSSLVQDGPGDEQNDPPSSLFFEEPQVSTLNTTVTPEPGSFVLVGSGLVAAAFWRRRRRAASPRSQQDA